VNKTVIYVAGIAILVITIILLWPQIFSGDSPPRSNEEVPAPSPSAFSSSAPAASPDVSPNAWETYSDPSRGLLFQYPQHFGTAYIHPVDWPPQVQVLQEPYHCTEGGNETARAGRTEARTVNGHQYCVTTVAEGAAGSLYYQYAYATQLVPAKTVIFTFTARAVQCGNYDEPRRTVCEQERESFNIDGIMDQVIQTARAM
jgi:hypothetical protein